MSFESPFVVISVRIRIYILYTRPDQQVLAITGFVL